MIQLSQINYSYTGFGSVLSGVNASFAEGHVYGLLGSNGAGKSTLIRIICGLLKPLAGSCLINGVDSFLREPDTLSLISYLPEEQAEIDITPKQYADVLKPFYPDFSEQLLHLCLDGFDVPKNQRINTMSLGQRKKALISVTIALNTPLLILDEPTNGLDIPSKVVFRRIISELDRTGRTVIISTHQVRDVEEIISAVMILENKTILLNQTIDSIGKKLRFGPVTAQDSPVYYESNINGSVGVALNTTGDPSRVDLEMLFNAAVTAPEVVSSVFNK